MIDINFYLHFGEIAVYQLSLNGAEEIINVILVMKTINDGISHQVALHYY